MSLQKKIVNSLVLAALAVSPAMSVLAQTRAVAPDAASDQPQNTPNRLQERKENVLERQQQRKENVRERVDTKRENVQQRKENIQDRREEMKNQREEKRQEARQRLDKRRKKIMRNHFARMMKRFEAALEREKKLGERIQSRIDKAKANGKNTAKAQAALNKAKKTWEEAKALLGEVRGKIDGVLSAADPKEAFKEVQTLVASVRDKIKAVHKDLVDAVTALKGIGADKERSASPTTIPAVSPAAATAPAPVE